MRANNQRSYVPDEEKTVAHVNQARELMEHAEHEREIALREEKIRYCTLCVCTLHCFVCTAIAI